jgi:phosphoribosylaminoimidazolecarboxamide formyltransferase/IMP cyclohydrolase
MIRASAKNHANVAVVTSPAQYPDVLAALADGGFTHDERVRLAVEAFAHTATYDIAVASWLGSVVAPEPEGFPRWLGAAWRRGDVLRYGENPHQRAAVYVTAHHEPSLAGAEQLQGKQMSYNNYIDADAARRAAFDQSEPAVAIIKHANPCGIAVGLDVAEAYRRAFATDPVSAFGGVVAANRTVTVEMVEAMADVFTEVLIAPDIEPEALARLEAKRNLRVLRVPGPHPGARIESRSISGGLLLQTADGLDAEGDDPTAWRLVAGTAVDDATLRDLKFAWRACRSVKSNAILLARSGAAVGIGMGQVNRVDAALLAVQRAGDRAAGSVAASDAFFPFPDGLQVLLDAGVRAVVQPGGSVRDEEVVAAAAAAGVAMYLTGTRHFLH